MTNEKDKKPWSDIARKAGITSLALSASMLGSGCRPEPVTIPTTSGGKATVNTITEYDAKRFMRSEINALLLAAKDLDKHQDVNFIKPSSYIETKEGFFGGMVLGSTYASHFKEGGGGTIFGFGGVVEGDFEKNKNFMDSLQSALEKLNNDNYSEMLLYLGDARDRLPRTKNPERKSEIETRLEEPLINIYKIAYAMNEASRIGTLFKSGNER